MTIDQLQETIAQQNRLISSQQLTMHQFQRQIADLEGSYKLAVERIRELEDQVAKMTT